MIKIIPTSIFMTKAPFFCGVSLISFYVDEERKKSICYLNGGSSTTFTGLDRMGPAAENY